MMFKRLHIYMRGDGRDLMWNNFEKKGLIR